MPKLSLYDRTASEKMTIGHTEKERVTAARDAGVTEFLSGKTGTVRTCSR